MTPLHFACTYSRPGSVEALLAGGASHRVSANDGSTPLHAAVAHPDTVRVLLAGADRPAGDQQQRTPCERAEAELSSLTHWTYAQRPARERGTAGGTMKIETLTSGIWQTNTTILSAGDRCVVVDPAYFPRELDAITARLREIGRADAIVFTHGHWDHVMGHSVAPDAPVWVNEVLAEAIRAGDAKTTRYLEDAREFDSRWYVPRSGYRWPERLHGISERSTLDIAGTQARVLHLPGHSPEGLGLVVDGTLLVGDYLSPCEIPFVDDARLYRDTLVRLLALLPALAEVIPGHGSRLSSSEAIAIARADLEYIERLLAAATLDAALAIPLPRAVEVVGMRDHHRENCTRLDKTRGG